MVYSMNLLRFLLLIIILVFPAPFILGRGYIINEALSLFYALSLFIPILILNWSKLKTNLDLNIGKWIYAYSWWTWTIIFIFSLLSFSQKLLHNWFIYYVYLLFYQILIVSTAWGLTKWLNYSKGIPILKSFNITLFYAPLPTLVFGNLFYGYLDPQIAMMSFPLIFNYLYLLFIWLIITGLMAIIIGMYPQKDIRHKFRRILATGLMSTIWLTLNTFLVSTYLFNIESSWLIAILPLYRESVLVYISPFILQFLITFLAERVVYYAIPNK